MVNIALIYFPYSGEIIYKFLNNLILILNPICDNITIIGANTNKLTINPSKVRTKPIKFSMHKLNYISPKLLSIFIWIIKLILIQILQSYELIKERNNYEIVIFYMAYPYFLIPLISAKFIGKKTMEVVTRSPSQSNLSKILSLQDYLFFELLDGISPESNGLLKLYNINYEEKILPEGSRYIDTKKYFIANTYKERAKCVGYIGRITQKKGVIEFIDAIKIIALKKKDISFIIIGSGDLLPWVQKECQLIRNELNVNILITGYIEDDEIPFYLNKLKLLVLPTQHSEGLPTIILEAIFCGTPVLTTEIGAISDVVIDNLTGYFLENTKKENLAKMIIEILERENLEFIIKNAHDIVEGKFSYTHTVERWENILEIMKKKDEIKLLKT